jgi:methyl-accepting chemotaxis protein
MKFDSLEKTILAIPTYLGTINSIIIHTLLFGGIYSLLLFGVPIETVNLTLTTIVSLEAIYLSIFIQLSVNQSQKNIEEVAHDVDEISEGMQEISHDIDEISQDLDILETEKAEKSVNTSTKTSLEFQLQQLQKQLTEIQKTLKTI